MAPIKGKPRDARSRTATPRSMSIDPTSAIGVKSLPASTMSYADMLEQHGQSPNPPGTSDLKKMLASLKSMSEYVKTRSEIYDRGMREFSSRKNEALRALEAARRDTEKERRDRRATPKRERSAERPLAVGAHSLARQDGEIEETDITEDQLDVPHALGDSTVKSRTSPSPSNTSNESHQPRPVPAVPQYQTFGPDPSAYDDPTIYHLREVRPGMSEAEKKGILGVADYPHSDLHEFTLGTPPDRDLVNAKPANQVTQAQFINYIEPYFRSFTEEDVAFLRERGDRVTPFVMPRRGPKHYRELWAEEDGSIFGDGTQSDEGSPNLASNSLGAHDEEMGEDSDLTTAPMLSRLLSTLRPERRMQPDQAQVNGENAMNGGMPNGDAANELASEEIRNMPSALLFAESNQPGWKNTVPKLSNLEFNERVKAELRYAGFLSEDAEPDYDGHHDDEVAARLRYLQEELKWSRTVWHSKNGAKLRKTLTTN